MPFVKHVLTASPIYACKLTPETQQEIADAISDGVTMGNLADLSMTLNDINGCQEYKFRYQNSTEWHTLNMNDWLIRSPNGTLLIMDDESFTSTYSNAEVDVIIPEEHKKTFEEAMVSYMNTAHPDLYMNQAQATITPYKNMVPTEVTANDKAGAVIEGSTVVVFPAHPQSDMGTDVAGMEIDIKLPSPLQITKYLIAQEGNSFNAPCEWTVTATNTVTGATKTIDTVTKDEAKPGYYNTDEPDFPADQYHFVFSTFEYDNQFVNNFRIALTSGGILMEAPAPTPLTEIDEKVMLDAREMLSNWYDEENDVFTINASTMGITSMDGFSKLVSGFLKASFIKSTTMVKVNLSNETVNEAANRYPNILNVAALQEFGYELKRLSRVDKNRVCMIDFSSHDADSPSAVAESVVMYNLSNWNEFVTSVISITGVQTAGDILK